MLLFQTWLEYTPTTCEWHCCILLTCRIKTTVWKGVIIIISFKLHPKIWFTDCLPWPLSAGYFFETAGYKNYKNPSPFLNLHETRILWEMWNHLVHKKSSPWSYKHTRNSVIYLYNSIFSGVGGGTFQPPCVYVLFIMYINIQYALLIVLIPIEHNNHLFSTTQ